MEASKIYGRRQTGWPSPNNQTVEQIGRIGGNIGDWKHRSETLAAAN